MAASEGETPLKMCLTAIEKKVRNLEKRKVSTLINKSPQAWLSVILRTLVTDQSYLRVLVKKGVYIKVGVVIVHWQVVVEGYLGSGILHM